MDREIFGAVINMSLWLFGLLFFFFYGRWVERKHLRRLDSDEAALSHITVCQLKNLPSGYTVTAEPVLVVGSVVLAIDYFKALKSSLKKVVGGRMGEYERLVERGRREAIIRMKQNAAEQGCNVVWNMRMESSMMANRRGGTNSVEVYAYGTAMVIQQSQ